MRPASASRIRTFAIAAICFLTAPAAMTAQRTTSLQGVVRDSVSGETLPHARIELTDLRRSAETNADGRFILVGVPMGAHPLRVQYIGYEPALMTVRVDTVTVPLVFRLRRSVVQLAASTITVDANASGVVAVVAPAVSQIAISTAQVEAMPSVGEVDVFRTLQMLPSVAGAGDGSASLSVRGGTADQNLVLLDGMTVYHVDHFFGLFSAFNTDALKDIQLYAGGFPARYGGRVSSVLDLTGKSGDEHILRASGGINLLSARGVVEIPLGRGAWLISGRRSYTDLVRSSLYGKLFDLSTGSSNAGTATPQQGPGNGRFGNAFQQQTVDPTFYFYDLNSKLTYRPSANDLVAFSVYSGRDNLDQSQSLAGRGGGPGGVDAAATSSLTDITTWGNRGLSARWFRQWNGRISSDALVASSRYTSDGDRTANGGAPNGGPRFNFGFSETNTVDDLTLRLDNGVQVAAASRVEFGTWITRNRVTYDFSVDVTDTTQRGRNTARDTRATLAAFYLQHTWTPVPALDVTAGVRAEHYDNTGDRYIEPRLSAGFQITPALRLKGAWGQYRQFVNRVENEDVLQGSRDFWLLADSTLHPTAAEHRIVGVAFDRPRWAINVEAYDKTLSDITLFSRRYRQAFGVNTGSFFYTGDGRARGVEMMLEKKRGALTGWGSYTLSKTTSTFADVDQGAEFPSSLDQRHELKGFGAYAMGKWQLSATALYGSGRPYTAPVAQYQVKLLDGSTQTYVHIGAKNGERLPSYQRADIALSRTIRTEGTFNWKVALSLYNVTNRRNVSYRQFDLSTSPMTITDIAQLGFTPSIDVSLTLRDVIRAFVKEQR